MGTPAISVRQLFAQEARQPECDLDLARVGRRDEAIDHLRGWLDYAAAWRAADRVWRLILKLERSGELDDGEEG